MKLAFNRQARYTDFSSGYELYIHRARKNAPVERAQYNRVVRMFCRKLTEHLLEYGIVDLPADTGFIAAATITRRPQYRGKKFIGFGGYDYAKKQYDGKLKTFGLVFLPKHDRNKNLRCFGYVANRQLYKRMRDKYNSGDCPWTPIDFNDNMI